jgi:hypothetical protein
LGIAVSKSNFLQLSPVSQQQDLPDATPFRRCLSRGRFTEWQFPADRDYQFAISHRFGHELDRFPVEFREY